ncbi:MAG: UDP-N-acetylglucosamine 2-epimerase (hydrolyzing) [Euryarchaeota archaeon]|nr:UDP-N-acetylglucosamine 2-epimerase (hydrolyzing) [Euryarchaeota archaeon]
MSKKKKIIFVTSTRADYGKLKTVIIKLQRNRNLITRVFVTGMHNMDSYGKTIGEIKKDKIKNLSVFVNQGPSSTMNRMLINTIRGFSDYLEKEKPDIVILHGDRVEPLGCAISALLSNVKIIHVEGGEVSGTVDEILRHAISKLSHIHFVSNKIAKNRLLQMGEDKKSIFVVGSPDVDVILSKKLPSIEKVKSRYNINFENYSISILHPVTTNLSNIKNEAKLYFESLKNSKKNYVITYPNNDIGSNYILNEIKKLRKNRNFTIIPSLRFEFFLTLLKNSSFIIGNSSCGIIEAPYYGVPTINIGDRQKNRFKSSSLINISFNKNKIIKAINHVNNKKLLKLNFFGKGNAANKIEKIINSKKFWDIKLQKGFIDLVK